MTCGAQGIRAAVVQAWCVRSSTGVPSVRQPVSNLTGNVRKARGQVRLICLTILVLLGLPTSAEQHAGSASEIASCRAIEVFHRRGCPHCGRALDFLADLVNQYPYVTIETFDISESSEARRRFITLNQSLGVQRPGVPSFLVCERFLVGFDTAETTGVEIKLLLGLVADSTESFSSDQVETAWFGAIDVETIGLPLFTLALGLIDGFNPCAMWVLLFLLSLLLHLKDRRRIVLIAGTFVVVSGVVYFTFMAAWLNLFLIIGVSRSLQFGVGLLAIFIGALHVKDFFSSNKGISLSIPDSAKPGIYARVRGVINAENLAVALVGVTVLAVLVNLIELVCTAGLPAVYTQVLAAQNLETASYYGYLLLYNVAYIVDDALMVGIVVYTLNHYKLGERYGRWLKLVSGGVISILGMLLVFAPQLLF